MADRRVRPDKEHIKQLYLAGRTTTQIAAELGLKSASTVHYHLVNMGVPRRPVGTPAADKTTLNTQLAYSLGRGLSDSEIGAELGLATESVRKYRNRARLLRPKGNKRPCRVVGQTAEIVALREKGLSLNAMTPAECLARFGAT